MKLVENAPKFLALAAVSVSLGGCAVGGESYYEHRKSELPKCGELDAVIERPNVTQDEVVRAAKGFNLSCLESNGSIRENTGGIG